MLSTQARTLTRIGIAVLLLAGASFADIGTGDGVAVCNCAASGDITGANIPHAKTVKVFVNSGSRRTDVGGHATGQPGVAFSNQTIAPGKCKYVRYTFECQQTPLQSVCYVTSFTLLERDATDAECPPEE